VSRKPAGLWRYRVGDPMLLVIGDLGHSLIGKVRTS
jgi:hypothetical protein